MEAPVKKIDDNWWKTFYVLFVTRRRNEYERPHLLPLIWLSIIVHSPYHEDKESQTQGQIKSKVYLGIQLPENAF